MLRIEVIGNLGADARVVDANGEKFISFRVAHSERWKTEAGEQKERTQWVDCILNKADHPVLPYLKQGVKVFARGHGSSRTYSSQQQRKILSSIQINVTEIELCGGNNDAVPREVIDPDTGSLYKTQKFYWTDFDTKKMKKEETKVMIDSKANQYILDKLGFVRPMVQPEDDAQDDTQQAGQ